MRVVEGGHRNAGACAGGLAGLRIDQRLGNAGRRRRRRLLHAADLARLGRCGACGPKCGRRSGRRSLRGWRPHGGRLFSRSFGGSTGGGGGRRIQRLALDRNDGRAGWERGGRSRCRRIGRAGLRYRGIRERRRIGPADLPFPRGLCRSSRIGSRGDPGIVKLGRGRLAVKRRTRTRSPAHRDRARRNGYRGLIRAQHGPLQQLGRRRRRPCTAHAGHAGRWRRPRRRTDSGRTRITRATP